MTSRMNGLGRASGPSPARGGSRGLRTGSRLGRKGEIATPSLDSGPSFPESALGEGGPCGQAPRRRPSAARPGPTRCRAWSVLAARGESRVARRSAPLRSKESDSVTAEAAFLAAEHGTPSSTQRREGARSRSSDFHHGLLARLFHAILSGRSASWRRIRPWAWAATIRLSSGERCAAVTRLRRSPAFTPMDMSGEGRP